MKKMICEICNSQSIKKENGVFVCQECGTEYSLEEAKLLLREISDEKIVDQPKASSHQIANSEENKYSLLKQLGCWLELVYQLESIYIWTGEHYENNNVFWNHLKELNLSSYSMINNVSSEQIIDFLFCSKNIPALDRIGLLDSPKFKGFDFREKINESDIIKFVKTIADNKTTGYQQQNFAKTWHPKFHLKDENGVLKELSRFSFEENDYKSTILFLIELYKNNKHYKLIETISHLDTNHFFWKVSYETKESAYGDIFEWCSKCNSLVEEIKGLINDKIDYLNKNMKNSIKLFNNLSNYASELEKEFFLPIDMRTTTAIQGIITVIKDGRADTWKEAINLFKDDTYKASVVNNLSSIKESLLSIENVLKIGLVAIDSHLQMIDEDIASISNQLNETNFALKNIMFDTRYQLIRDIIK